MRPVFKYQGTRMSRQMAAYQAGHARRELSGYAENAAKNGSVAEQNCQIYEAGT